MHVLRGPWKELAWHEESMGKLRTLEADSPALNPALCFPTSLVSGKFAVLWQCIIVCKMNRVLSNLKGCYENEI